MLLSVLVLLVLRQLWKEFTSRKHVTSCMDKCIRAELQCPQSDSCKRVKLFLLSCGEAQVSHMPSGSQRSHTDGLLKQGSFVTDSAKCLYFLPCYFDFGVTFKGNLR